VSEGRRVLYPFPEELGRIPRDRSAVIEASAGTGKTYLIEHLVVDRLVRGEAGLDQMLVVTFTDRAAAELQRRIGALIERVRTADGSAAPTSSGAAWPIDDAVRERLAAAARTVDSAPISTIHAFCQRVLTEQAFASGRLLVQQSVESRAAFASAFAEVLRQQLAVEIDHVPYLDAYLSRGGTVENLERLLYQAHQRRARWATSFDPERVIAASRAFSKLSMPVIELGVKLGVNGRSAASVRRRLATLHEFCRRLDGDGNVARFLAALDMQVSGEDLLSYVVERFTQKATEVGAIVAELAAAAVPLDTAIGQKFGPPVADRVEARKRAAGLYDFDDMLLLVAGALRGPRGAELIDTLRRRFKLAIVDEFQDTDRVQWDIFRTIWGAGGGPLYLVGDAKQSIYGFRGADVSTYVAACDSVAPPSDRHPLRRNFRSTARVVDAYNAILDQEAAAPFFTGGVRYDTPVTVGRQDGDGVDALAPITLLWVTAEAGVEKLRMRAVRESLASAVATEISALLLGADPPRASEIFVLTRTWIEAKAVASALAARAVASVTYNQEGLYASPEALQVRDLLRAIADPRDPAKRLRAWLTPFFGLTLADLPAAMSADGDHPLYARLFAWHEAAAREPFGRLGARILADSGVVLRELFLNQSARRLVNIRHLFEVLTAQDARAARPLGDVVRRLSALCEKLLVPEAEEGNVQRLEGDRDAVQIMTVHKAKGLEADIVFLYGGFSAVQDRGVRQYTDGGERLAIAGGPRNPRVKELLAAERASEDQRLFYVALTRARRRLYLPFSGEAPEAEAPADGGGVREVDWKLTGGYTHVNRRLRALCTDKTQHRHFEFRKVPIDPQGTGEGARPRATVGLVGWRPEPDEGPAPATAELGRLARERRGPTLTSYSRIKHAEGGYRPPTEIHDETTEAPPLATDDELPGGARAGVFVHDLLERVSLETLRDAPDFEAWRAREDVRALLEATLRRHARDPRQLAPAARMAYAALTAPLPVLGGVLPGLAHAARCAREMEFLFPFPEAAGGADRGYVKGFVDVIFEHEGRVYFGDWKTDRLASWDEAAIETHVTRNYALQEQLYALALVRMLGIDTAADYEARFGGTLYLFVRGLPGAIRSRRPAFTEITAWQEEIAARLAEGKT
jgi:exodeoxyribonuclease V beta subunit